MMGIIGVGKFERNRFVRSSLYQRESWQAIEGEKGVLIAAEKLYEKLPPYEITSGE
jgi:hypothetical protein